MEALRVHGGVKSSYHSTRDLKEKCAKTEFPIFRIPGRDVNSLIVKSTCKLPPGRVKCSPKLFPIDLDHVWNSPRINFIVSGSYNDNSSQQQLLLANTG